MLRFAAVWAQSLRREQGQDLAEYALLIALIGVVLVLVVGAMSGGLANIFNTLRNALESGRTNQIQP
ncbi:MAG: Flp family type IVb pilin [Anaerolineae bacterium]|nr:Flp family type IVb pilin [Anaerolineae bacterium]